MNNTKRMWVALAATSFAFAIAASPAVAQDKAKPAAAKPAEKGADKGAAAIRDQRDRKLLVDNDRVVVTENVYKVGASSGPMAERGARVTRALTEGTLERIYPDGRKETIQWKAGQVRFNPKETFTQKNVGKTDVILYTVTLK